MHRLFLPLLLLISSVGTIAADDSRLTIEQLSEAEQTIGNPESTRYDEEAFCKMLRQALDAKILDEADRMRANYRIKIAAKNRKGSKAADFRMKLRDGSETSLHRISTQKPILLVFYDPDCDHCMKTIRKLRGLRDLFKAQVVAVYAEDDTERWEETAADLPESWIVGRALDPIQDDETYVFLTSPTLYFLTPGKNVILKDTSLKAIEKKLAVNR